MAENDDILGKADALLRRHVPPRAGRGEGSEVPVLTELITPGGSRAASAPPAEATRKVTPEPDGRDDEVRRQLVAEIADTVRSRLAQDLERRLTDKVLVEIRGAVTASLGELRPDIARAVDEAVTEALKRHPSR